MIDMFYYIQVGVRIEYRGSIGNVATRTLLRIFSGEKIGIAEGIVLLICATWSQSLYRIHASMNPILIKFET